METVCRHCGAEIHPGEYRCPKCGAEASDANAAYTEGRTYIDPPENPYSAYNSREYAAAQSGYSSGYTPPPPEQGAYGAQGHTQSQVPGQREQPPHPDSPYAPVGMGAFMGLQILMWFPVVNLIMMIIFAAGASKKINLRNYARATLVVILIQFVLFVIVIFSLASVFGELLYQFEDFLNYI